jgi:hypothetical protein
LEKLLLLWVMLVVQQPLLLEISKVARVKIAVPIAEIRVVKIGRTKNVEKKIL